MLQEIFESVFGSYNSRQIRKLERHVPWINEEELKMQALSDEELKTKFTQWKNYLTTNPDKTDEMLVEVFAGIKNAARRLVGKKFEVRGKEQTWEMVHFDVQLIGGIVLHQGKISEMKTGEGKTLVCTLPVILNALTGRGVHVVTVNDYLAQRDAEWMKPLYEFCGLTVGVVVHEKTNPERVEAYRSDITYGTNNEFGFDYLRDNMIQNASEIVQRELHYAIVDEVDSILIDEARTPLIISSPAAESTEKYAQYARFVPQLKETEDFIIDQKLKSISLTEGGIKKVENFLGISNVFTESGFEEVHHIEQSLKAQFIFEKDRDYVVRDNNVIIVDEFTGRLMPGRRYSDGLHQALEAKEKVEIQRESKTLATVTFQNYFRLYKKLAGMTGTAETEAEEFAKIYKLDTLVIPTNRQMKRQDLPDKIFKNERGKFLAIAKEVEKINKTGQPVLIGTISIEKSERLSDLLKERGIKHEVLNAKQHEREAEIVSNAGQMGAVTIATNMAGRGTDIKLGQGIVELGGLVILGTERHESRRIDNQLRGRAGRQGDPGISQFYVAMTDDLMRRFGGEKMASLMQRLGIPDDEPIQNGMISRSVENAQKKIESFHFDARKHVVQYDDVMNVHREKVYAKRRSMLGSEDISGEIETMVRTLAENVVQNHCFNSSSDSHWDLNGIIDTISTVVPNLDRNDIQNEWGDFSHRSDLVDSMVKYILMAWEEKKKEFPVEKVDEISKYIILRSIDELWLEHIDLMSHLRDRVALSGYAQKDPVMEYKREAFDMFRKLMFQIRLNAVQNMFRVQYTGGFEMEANDYSDAQTNADQINAALENTGEYERPDESEHFESSTPGRSVVAEKLGEKYANVGRNDLCPCGSGQKFKKCHGKGL